MALETDQMKQVRGFSVEVSGAGASGADAHWDSVTGGALNLEVADGSVSTDQYHQTTPAAKYIDELTLIGNMTKTRKYMTEWIMDTIKGKPCRRSITIKEILHDGSAGKSYVYEECFVTRVRFPRLSADGTGILKDEVTVKPLRLTVQ